ncbi:hypothetical protein [Fusobacterium perfoetens]|uniref:hypothetical protein n=1 Tax=Fusobacterium perfoetens TaxID=852 RepID=UPI0026EC5B99|nr:hypothetical protein [Fusobacterium perfoetens]
MKKYLKTIIFLILSTFSFAKWELDTQYNMIFTSAIKTIPSQEALLYIKKGNSLKDFNYHSLYILVEKYTPFVKEVD